MSNKWGWRDAGPVEFVHFPNDEVHPNEDSQAAAFVGALKGAEMSKADEIKNLAACLATCVTEDALIHYEQRLHAAIDAQQAEIEALREKIMKLHDRSYALAEDLRKKDEEIARLRNVLLDWM